MQFSSGFNFMLTLAMAALSLGLNGCVAHPGTKRPHVSSELACRTGHDLGPHKPPCETLFPEAVHWDDGLSEEEAVILGLWNNPSYQELLVDLQITRADLITASQLTNPQVTNLFPIGVKQWEFYLSLPIDVIWLRPRRVAIAQLENQRVAERLVQDGLNVVRDIRVAYADLVFAEQRFALAEYGFSLRNEMARIGEALLDAGAVSELDISPVRLEALFGEEELARSAREVDIARARFRFQIGLATSDVPINLGPASLASPPPLDPELLIAEAITSRPDVRALELAFTAAVERRSLARWDYFNIQAFLPDANGKGEKGFEAGPGLRFDAPILNQNQGAKARTAAEAERLRRQFVTRRDTAATEVRLAYAQLLQAEQTLAIWREQVVPQAQTATDIARNAFEEDAVSVFVVLETTRQLLIGRARELESEAGLRRAVAELERSVGRRILTTLPPRRTMEIVPLPQPAGPQVNQP